jgi:hypothetical protein
MRRQPRVPHVAERDAPPLHRSSRSFDLAENILIRFDPDFICYGSRAMQAFLLSDCSCRCSIPPPMSP